VIAMKDFSRQPRVVEFKIDNDIFRGKPFLAAQTMIDFTLKVDSLGDDLTAQQGFDTMKESLEQVLMADSYARFTSRMRDPNGTAESCETVVARVREAVLQAVTGGAQMIPTTLLAEILEPRDKQPVAVEPGNHPIELPQVNEIIEWIMGEYGMRPPTSAGASSDGPSIPTSGTNSTGSTSHVESISSNSQPTSS
jgi:hypothetical protein